MVVEAAKTNKMLVLVMRYKYKAMYHDLKN